VLYFLTLYFQDVHRYDALETGVAVATIPLRGLEDREHADQPRTGFRARGPSRIKVCFGTACTNPLDSALMIVRRDEKVRLISRVPLFKACSQAELARIATITTQVELPKGEVLFREGAPGDDFFVLVKGSAEVRTGKRHFGTLKASDFAGEIALLSDAPRTATVTLTSPVTALRATRKGFSELLKTASSIQQKLLTTLAERVASTAV
jgi:CRP/FNR family cyclic AMP-dependent transcriptional regulator